MSQRKKSGFMGMLIGAAAGVVAGVYALAPKSAKENREDLKRSTQRLKDNTERQFKKISAELDAQVDRLSEQYKNTRGKAREEWEEWKKRGEDMQTQLKDIVTKDEPASVKDSLMEKTKAFVQEVNDRLSEEADGKKTSTKK